MTSILYDFSGVCPVSISVVGLSHRGGSQMVAESFLSSSGCLVGWVVWLVGWLVCLDKQHRKVE